MPRSRNTRLRPKNTDRAEARRRHRDEQREAAEPNTLTDDVNSSASGEAAEAQPSRSAFALPNVAEDIRAIPQIFRKPLVWLPFGLLLLSFGIAMAMVYDALPEGQISEILRLFVELSLPPTSLFIFFIGGFVAPRGAYLVGALLGLWDALLYTIVLLSGEVELEGAALAQPVEGDGGIQDYAVLWGIALFVGIVAASFAAWYRRFLRSSQARAAANRAQRERENAQKAKDQAKEDKAQIRADKEAARESRRKDAGDS